MTRTRTASNRARALVAFTALLALGAVACSTVEAQTPPPAQQSGIAVEGTGSVSVPPDIAEVQLGVEARAGTVEEAREEAAEAMEEVRDAVLAQGVDEADIQTRRFSIRPEHARGDGQQPEIVGYVVSNRLAVAIRDIDAVSNVIDSAIAAGGDEARVDGIRFTVDEPEQYADQARHDAVALARERGEALAAAAGVALGDPRFIAETSTTPVPPRAPAQAPVPEADDLETPIEPGEQEIQINVSVIFDIE